MFKILGLLSLSTAYSLSVMYFEGVKLGDLQVHYTSWYTCQNGWTASLLAPVRMQANDGQAMM